MKSFFCLVFCVAILTGDISTQAQEEPWHIPDIVTHQISSNRVDQTFEIRVWQPVSRTDGSESFPVLYVTDSNAGIFLQGMMHYAQLGGDVQRFIMVGIGYPVGHTLGGLNLRWRDLTPTPSENIGAGSGLPIEGIPEIKSGKRSGGAGEFLSFIREELIPFIDGNYNTIEGDRAFFGHSFGGLFGLYTLLHQPDTFNRYIIGSPSIWYDDAISLKYAKAFMASDREVNARVYMSVGELENEAKWQMVSNVYRMNAILNSRVVPGFTAKMHVFPDETHMTVAAFNLIRGVQEVFDKPACDFLVPDCR